MSTTPPETTRPPAFPDRDRVLSAFFESAPDRMAILDADGLILEVNAAWKGAAAACGWTEPGAGVGWNYLEVARSADEPDAARVTDGLSRVLAGRTRLFEHEYECSAPGAPEQWFAMRTYPVSSAPLRVAVVHTETTEAQRTRRALAEAREQQWQILEQAAEAVLVTSADGRILQANARAAELFGYAAHELEGMDVGALVTREDLARQPLEFPLLRDGREVRREREGRRKDGSTLSFEVSSRMLGDGRVLALVRDTSERKRRALALERQATLLSERVKEQRCLYAVSRALAEGGAGIREVLEAVVAVLPAGWQYPALATACITVDAIDVRSSGHAAGRYRQQAPLRIDGEIRGRVEVAYREKPPEPWRGGQLLTADEAEEGEAGCFLREERSLLDEVAARLTEAIRRHRAEDRLRRSEAYFRALTEKGSDLVSITTADGTLVYQSPPLVEALGVRPEERVGKSIFDRIHPDDIDRVRTEFGRAMADADYQPTIEFRIRHGDGSWRVLESTSRNLLDDPAVNGVVIESRDVTARWETRTRIRFQAQILDLVGQAVVATDTAGRITYWNRAAQDLYGWSRDEVLTRNIQEVIPLDPSQASSTSLLEAVERGARWTGELMAARRDGSRFPALVVDTPILDADGNLAGYVAVATDISDRKTAEMALQASEEWSRALIEHSSDLTLVLDAERRIVYASPNRERILGSAPEPFVGKDSSALLRVHPEDREDAQRLWNEVYASPGATVRAAVRVEHADGTWRTLECNGRNLLENEAVRGVVVNARDVTDRVQLEQQLLHAQKMEAIGSLAGGIAHDFNNILTGIQGHTQLSLEELPADHRVRPNLDEIARAADRAAQLTRQLLAFSRRQMMQPRVVDPNQTVRELRRMLTRLIGEDVVLSTELAEDPGCVLVDPGQIEQVILNLAVNARDAMPGGGELRIRTAPVELEARDLADAEGLEPGPYVELDVSDTGGGMAPEVLERVFEPFFTTKELGKGTGLGLSTVYGIVKQSGGHIRVESLPNAGTTFRVFFPRVEGQPDREESRAAGGGARRGETVLLVEDDSTVRGLASRILSGRGYRVIEARNGAEAWSTFRADPAAIDLVLSDVVMPEMGGRELLERVMAERPGIPVILMSGYTDDIILRHGARDAGVAFLEKPFTPAALAEQVREALERTDARPDREGGAGPGPGPEG
ncbi:MAG TPA: PAS domain S-box protein [Longimicrobiales bacterium]|nr:PAS domain S-box protein [Longimicrobiales bacterium]